MCKLIVATKKPGENPELISLIMAQTTSLKQEDDGIGALLMNSKGEILTKRAFIKERYEEVMEFVETNFSDAVFISIHTRTGTSGEKSLENVHFFEVDGHYMAHNGFVSRYGSYARHNGGTRSMGFTSTNDYFKSQGIITLDDDDDIPQTPLDGIAGAYEDAQMMLIFEDIQTCHGCQDSKRGLCKKHARQMEKRASELGYKVDNGEVSIPIITPEKKEPSKETTLKNGEIITEKYCDTWHFLKYLPKPASIENIKSHIDHTDFMGMGVVVEKTSGNVFVFAQDKQCYVLSRQKETKRYSPYLFISSYDPELSLEEVDIKEVMGVLTIKSGETKELGIEPEELLQGVYQLPIPINK